MDLRFKDDGDIYVPGRAKEVLNLFFFSLNAIHTSISALLKIHEVAK